VGALRNELGLTLTEVLLALAVLSIGLVALVSLLPFAATGIHEGGHRSAAAFLAAARLEQLRHGIGSDRGLLSFPDESSLAAPHAGFDRKVRIRDCGLPPGCAGLESPGVHHVTVTVSYPPVAGRPAGAPAHRGAVILTTFVGAR
jgi:prepilin-type N-terminal cleavage/methylation domain-containing protein